MKIDLPARRPRRRINLTPMIDVVLMLLVFFMMVSRFGGTQGIGLQVAAPAAPATPVDWSGPPRLVSVGAEGLRLNGVAMAVEDLPEALADLMASPEDPVILRTEAEAPVQALVAVMDALQAAGITRLYVMDAP
jgi:biopolymer transport protein ExbD